MSLLILLLSPNINIRASVKHQIIPTYKICNAGIRTTFPISLLPHTHLIFSYYFFPTHFISHRWLSMDAMCFNNHSFFRAIIPFHWICGIDFGRSSCFITHCRRNKSILNFITVSSPWWLTMGNFFAKKAHDSSWILRFPLKVSYTLQVCMWIWCVWLLTSTSDCTRSRTQLFTTSADCHRI